MKIKIAPSILSADFGRINEEIKGIEPYSDYIHVDVMDGVFVPNITIGQEVLKNLKSSKPFDVHLMIVEPEKHIEAFAKAGAGIITVHAEASMHLHRTLQLIKELGKKAGVSLNPSTPLSAIENILDDADMVLIMSVNPGFGGQNFIPQVLEKVRNLRKMKPELDIEIDGGIEPKTARDAINAGANVLVSGSYIFRQRDRVKAIESLRNAAR